MYDVCHVAVCTAESHILVIPLLDIRFNRPRKLPALRAESKHAAPHLMPGKRMLDIKRHLCLPYQAITQTKVAGRGSLPKFASLPAGSRIWQVPGTPRKIMGSGNNHVGLAGQKFPGIIRNFKPRNYASLGAFASRLYTTCYQSQDGQVVRSAQVPATPPSSWGKHDWHCLQQPILTIGVLILTSAC